MKGTQSLATIRYALSPLCLLVVRRYKHGKLKYNNYDSFLAVFRCVQVQRVIMAYCERRARGCSFNLSTMVTNLKAKHRVNEQLCGYRLCGSCNPRYICCLRLPGAASGMVIISMSVFVEGGAGIEPALAVSCAPVYQRPCCFQQLNKCSSRFGGRGQGLPRLCGAHLPFLQDEYCGGFRVLADSLR